MLSKNFEQVKYAFFDVDGTILNENLEVPKELLNCISELKKNNVISIICTGRSLPSMKELWDKWSLGEVFYHKFTVEHRIEMLHGVAESCRKGSYRILQKPLNHLPSNLHLCIRGNVGTLIFQKYNGEVMLFTIQEYGLLETFLDYLQNMLESSFYTSEEAAAYVESIIYQLENGELS